MPGSGSGSDLARAEQELLRANRGLRSSLEAMELVAREAREVVTEQAERRRSCESKLLGQLQLKPPSGGSTDNGDGTDDVYERTANELAGLRQQIAEAGRKQSGLERKHAEVCVSNSELEEYKETVGQALRALQLLVAQVQVAGGGGSQALSSTPEGGGAAAALELKQVLSTARTTARQRECLELFSALERCATRAAESRAAHGRTREAERQRQEHLAARVDTAEARAAELAEEVNHRLEPRSPPLDRFWGCTCRLG
jgi:hypothetical protein